jgi:DNA-binding MarR family transcriptional regulator
VTANQFVLLALLAEEDRVTQRKLVERASSDQNTVRPMLLALEAKGLVTRARHPTDGRAWSVALTAKGRRSYGKLWAKTEACRERLVTALGPGEPEALLDLLGRVSRAMEPRRRASAAAAGCKGSPRGKRRPGDDG